MATPSEGLRKLRKLIGDQKVAMLTTVEPDGTLRSRPMFTQQVEFDGDLWFFTAEDSRKVHEVERDQHVNVSYCDPKEHSFVSICGVATVVQDEAKMRALWNPLYKAWVPDGLEDRRLALLKVHVQKAEYWDRPSGRMVQLFGLVRAKLTGKRYQPGEHGEIRL